MNTRLTLIDVLQPKSFRITPERARVTRTIVQPEIDAFEQMESQVASKGKSALAARQPAEMAAQLAGA
jgi:hypothetical protein